MTWIYFGILLLVLITLLFMSAMFYVEKEAIGSKRALFVFLTILSYYILSILFFPEPLILINSIALLAIILLLIYPFKKDLGLTADKPLQRYDERDIMFSRNELKPRSPRYIQYYNKEPEKEILDNAFRSQPGLLSREAIYYHAGAFESAKHYFSQVKLLTPQIKGIPNSIRKITEPEKISKALKKRILNLGALKAGITLCQNYHFYSHKGRGESYGKEININHRFAIAFTVEMDQDMVAAAPKASIVMESARQYLNSGKIAVEIAEYIRSIGYDARAHIDGNYELICPLVARDAGLGEIGRMGILMTPIQGPRVRIGVVTTDLELIPDDYKKNHSLIDFCNRCKKCADCCPSASIPFDEPTLINGVKRWKINSESCFTFWCKAGTDCGRCMAVCPYSHPNSFLHKLIRWGIQHSMIFRIIAIYLDDFFYGKKPKSKPLPKHL